MIRQCLHLREPVLNTTDTRQVKLSEKSVVVLR